MESPGWLAAVQCRKAVDIPILATGHQVPSLWAAQPRCPVLEGRSLLESRMQVGSIVDRGANSAPIIVPSRIAISGHMG